MNISDDELLEFTNDPEYPAKLNAALAALDEIVTDQNWVLTRPYAIYWLEKHRRAFEKIGSWDIFEPVLKWTPFAQLYGELQALNEFIDNYEVDILMYYSNMPHESEENQLLEWTLKLEILFDSLPMELSYPYMLQNLDAETRQTERLIVKDPLVETLYALFQCYKHHETVLFKKLCIYTDDELLELSGHQEYADMDLYKLSFHIARRKEMEAFGINLPLPPK